MLYLVTTYSYVALVDSYNYIYIILYIIISYTCTEIDRFKLATDVESIEVNCVIIIILVYIKI